MPAIEGKSRFHFIIEAMPKIIRISEKEINKREREIFNFLYLTRIIMLTAKRDIEPASKIE